MRHFHTIGEYRQSLHNEYAAAVRQANEPKQTRVLRAARNAYATALYNVVHAMDDTWIGPDPRTAKPLVDCHE